MELTFAVAPSDRKMSTMRSIAAAGQARNVLAEIDGEIGFAVRLIGGDGASRHFGEDALADPLEPPAVGLAPFPR